MRTLLVVVLGLCACSTEVTSNNPFDPGTPGAQQSKGAVSGSLVLPAQYEAARFADFEVELDADDGPAVRTGVAADGAFAFDEVLAGAYTLRVDAPGFVAAEQRLVLDIGEREALDPIELSESGLGTIRGTAHKGGAAADGHEGVLVEALGSPARDLSEPDGSFRLEVAPGTYDLKVGAAGYSPETLPRIVVKVGETTRIEDTLRLVGRPGVIRGTVRLPEQFAGAGLEAAEVSVSPWGDEEIIEGLNPNSAGAFVFAPLSASDYALRVTLGGFEAQELRVPLAVAQEVDLDLELHPLEARSGVLGVAQRVGDSSHAGIRVEAIGTPFASATTSEGRFQLALPPADYTLRFTSPGYGAEQISVSVGSELLELVDPVLLSGQPGAITAQVRFAEGTGSEELRAAIEVNLRDVGGEVAQRSGVGAKGQLRFADVAAGTYDLEVRLAGFHVDPARVQVAVGEVADAGLMVLRPRIEDGVIVGHARVLGGGPLAHGDIEVLAEGFGFTTTTNDEGAYRLRATARPAGYTLVFSRPGYSSPRIEVGTVVAGLETQAEETTLTAQPGRVTGAIRLDDIEGIAFEDVELLRSAVVELTPIGREAPIATESPAANGQFAFEAVVPGSYALTVSLIGFNPVDRRVEVLVGREASLGIIRLVPRIAGEQASFIDGVVRVDCGLPECDHGGVRVEVLDRPFVTQTVGDGRFRLQVIAGSYTLRFSRAGYLSQERADLEVSAGETVVLQDPAEAVLAFDPATLSGRVMRKTALDEHVPALGAVVSAVGPSEPPNAVVDDDGGFTLAGLRAGTYLVTAALDGHQASQRHVVVEAGEQKVLEDFVLDLPRGAISGRVVGGAPASVVLRGVAGGPLSDLRRLVAADAEGRWQLEALPQGDYELRAIAEGLRSPPWRPESVAAGARRVEDLVLRPWLHVMHAPEVVAEVAQLRFEADPELDHAQVWLGDAAPGAYVPLDGAGADTIDFGLPAEGVHRVRARLANAQARNEDAGDDLFAYTSPTLEAFVVRDETAPELLAVSSPDPLSERAFTLDVDCADALAPAERLSLEVRAGEDLLYEGAYQPRLALQLPGDEGPRTLDVICRDWAGLEAERAHPVVLDLSPPVVQRFTIASEANLAVADRNLDVFIESSDDAVATAVSEDPNLDCSAADYAHPPQGAFPFRLTPGEGPRSLFACAIDAAGHVSQRVESQQVILDTIAPQAGRLLLAEDAAWTSSARVSLRVEGEEAGLALTLLEGLEPAQLDRFEAGDFPALVHLAGPDGIKLVTAIYTDAAGNASRPFSDFIRLDRLNPSPAIVSLAEGRAVVNSRTVPVSVAGTDADLMRFWEVAPGDLCGEASCADPGYQAFSPASTFTLSEGQGDKQVCWHFCDLAGNGTVVAGGTLELGVHVTRPRPILDADALEPARYLALSREDLDAPRYPLTIVGRGIAADSFAQVGDFVLPCEAQGGESCRTDPDEGCAEVGACEDTCARRCTVALPSAVVENAGSYLVRLRTPPPVVGDGGSEDSVFFLVVAPTPAIERFTPSALVLELDAEGAPQPPTFEVVVETRDLMDNAVFQIGPNAAEVLDIERDPEQRRLATARLLVSSSGLPLDLDAALFLSATNPPPGGGSTLPHAFGVQPKVGDCPNAGPCVTSMRHSRMPLPNGLGRYVDFTLGEVFSTQLIVQGATAATILDTRGRMLGRTRLRPEGGRVLLPFAEIGAIRLEDDRGLNQPLSVRPAPTETSLQRWADPVIVHASHNVQPEIADLDADGILDLAISEADGILSIRRGLGDGSFGAALAIQMGEVFHRPRIADLNGDGLPDLIGGDPQNHRPVWRLGLGDLEYAPLQVGPSTTGDATNLLDWNRDGITDLLHLRRGGNFYTNISLGTGAGGFRLLQRCVGGLPAGCLLLPPPAQPYSTYGDIDGDGRLDHFSSNEYRLGVEDEGFVGRVDLTNPLTGHDQRFNGVSDLDLDGDGDLVKGKLSQVLLRVWPSFGDGRVSTQPHNVPLPALPKHDAIVLADLTDDQLPDVLAPLLDDPGLMLLPGRSDGDFEGPELFPGGVGSHVDAFAADLDLDGAQDLLLVRKVEDGETLETRMGAGVAPTIGFATYTSVQDRHMQVADLNDDDILDVVFAEKVTVNSADRAGVAVHIGQADGSFARLQDTLILSTNRYNHVAVGDVTGDGVPDVVTGARSGGTCGLAIGAGDGSFAASLLAGVTTNNPPFLELVDLNRDGHPDLVYAEFGEGRLYVHFSENGRVDNTRRIVADNLGDTRQIAFGDLDGDDWIDIVVAGRDRGGVVLHNDQAGGFVEQPDAAFPDAEAVALGDFNGDERLDLALMRDTPAGELGYWWGTEQGLVAGGAALIEAMHDIRVLRAADMNGDGVTDLVTIGDALAVIPSDGAGGFHPEASYALPSLSSSLALVDVDDNGVMDVVFGRGVALNVWGRLPSRVWRQELRAMPAPSIPIEGATTTTVHQAMQRVDALGVRVRLGGGQMENVRLSLRSPRGEEIELTASAEPAAGFEVYSQYFSGALLDDMLGWQPQGDWRLTAEPIGETTSAILDFRVMTTGRFVVARP